MKSLISFSVSSLVFLTASLALAMPSVGDYSSAGFTSTSESGAVKTGTLEYEIVGFDPVKNRYEIKVTTTVALAANFRLVWISVGDSSIPTEVMITDMVSHCPSYGGTNEQVTVPAGTFASCKDLNSDGVTIWHADVPFGAVKVDYTDPETGDHVVSELTQYRLAQ